MGELKCVHHLALGCFCHCHAWVLNMQCNLNVNHQIFQPVQWHCSLPIGHTLCYVLEESLSWATFRAKNQVSAWMHRSLTVCWSLWQHVVLRCLFCHAKVLRLTVTMVALQVLELSWTPSWSGNWSTDLHLNWCSSSKRAHLARTVSAVVALCNSQLNARMEMFRLVVIHWLSRIVHAGCPVQIEYGGTCTQLFVVVTKQW